jgi:signal transduction histidine kinase
VDLVALVSEAVGDAAAATRGAGVQIDALLADDQLTLEGDPGQLRRVLDNLLSNAVKYSPDGGPVEVRLHADGTTAVLEVADRGIGIAAAEVEHLFTRFYRASAVRDGEIHGSGLGLSISRSIVAAHEGTIALESVDGEGTTVRVRLPLTRR